MASSRKRHYFGHGKLSTVTVLSIVFITCALGQAAKPSALLPTFHGNGAHDCNHTPIMAKDLTNVPPCQRDLPCSSATSTFLADVTVVADNWACAAAGGTIPSVMRAISELVSKVSDLFESQTCLRLQLLYTAVDCNPSTDALAYLSTFARPRDLLLEVKNVMTYRYATYASHVSVFVTGYDDGSAENGFAFQDAFFQREFSVIWIAGFDATELAQNIGFLLGASPARRGVMRIKPGDTEFTLARKSRKQIKSFLDANLRNEQRCLNTVAPPTPTTTPASSILPSYLKTCDISNAPDKLIRCVPSGRRAGIILTHFGKVSIFLSQTYGTLRVRASVAKEDAERNNGIRIRDIRVLVWANSDTTKMRKIFGWYHPLVSEQKYHGIAWLWAKIDVAPGLFVIPNSWSTCCHRNVFVHTQVTVEVPAGGTVEQTLGFGVFQHNIGCGDPCKDIPGGQRVEAQFPSQKCYTCISP